MGVFWLFFVDLELGCFRKKTPCGFKVGSFSCNVDRWVCELLGLSYTVNWELLEGLQELYLEEYQSLINAHDLSYMFQSPTQEDSLRRGNEIRSSSCEQWPHDKNACQWFGSGRIVRATREIGSGIHSSFVFFVPTEKIGNTGNDILDELAAYSGSSRVFGR